MSAKASEKRVRAFGGVVYPDSESYNFESVLEALEELFTEWAYVVHDCDVDDDGNAKKTHIHWVGRAENAKTVLAVAKKLGLQEHEIEIVRNWKKMLRYLVHADSPNKYQYPVSAVVCCDGIDYNALVQGGADYLQWQIFCELEKGHFSTMTDLGRWAHENGCWSEFRRNVALWNMLLREAEARCMKG